MFDGQDCKSKSRVISLRLGLKSESVVGKASYEYNVADKKQIRIEKKLLVSNSQPEINGRLNC